MAPARRAARLLWLSQASARGWSLRGPYAPPRPSRSNAYPARPHISGLKPRLETDMADIFFFTLGTGAFALFGLYAALLRKV